MKDGIPLASGETFRFSPPSGTELPSAGYTPGMLGLYPSPVPEPQPETEIVISPTSQRLEILEPFKSQFGPESGNPRGMELPACKVLMRVRGKCTTDHISAAGPWLKYKGHLTNISENLCACYAQVR
jgi:homoaconitase